MRGDCVTGFRNIGISFPPWTAFLAVPSQNSWYQKHAGTGPVYALPEKFTKRLAPSLPTDAIEIECGFTRCCIETGDNVIGLWNDVPIIHNLIALTGRKKAFPDGLVRDARRGPRTFEQVRSFLESLDKIDELPRRECIRHAGQLVVNPEYIAHMGTLKQAWIPIANCVPFPLARRGGASRDGEDITDFIRALGKFLDRWQLARLDTWDLPVPIGTYDEMPLRGLAALYPNAKLRNSMPEHVAPQKGTPRREESYGRIKLSGEEELRFKRALAEDTTSTEEWTYLLRHIEHAFRARHGTPRGYREILTGAFMEFTGLGQDRITQIVKLYLPMMPPVVG